MAETDNLKDDGSHARAREESGDPQPQSGEVAKEASTQTMSATQDAENEPKSDPAIKPSSEPSMMEEDDAETGLVDHVIRWGPLILIVFLILVMSD